MKQIKDLKVLYDYMLSTGELFEHMPKASGIYEEDKPRFESVYRGLTDFTEERD